MSWKSTAALPVLAAMLPVALVALAHDWRFLPLHVAVLAGVLAVAWHGSLIDRALENAPVWRWCLMAAASLAMVWSLVGGSPRAQWGMIDDHEIQDFIGAGRDRIPATPLPSTLGAFMELE